MPRRSAGDVAKLTLEFIGELFGATGCQGCIMVPIGMLFGIVWIIAHKRQIIHGGFSVGVATLIVVGFYATVTRGPRIVARIRRGKPNDATAGPTPIANIQPGSVHTAGLVQHTTQLFTPFEDQLCVFYRITIESDAGHALYSAQSSEELVLEDGGTAHLVVKLEDATWKLARELVFEGARVARYLAERGIETDQRVRAHVECIRPNELVFVRGVVKRVGKDEADYRTNQSAELVMTSATITLDDRA